MKPRLFAGADRSMKDPFMASSENQLIAQLPDGERRRLLALSEPFEMVLSAELSERGQPLTHAHFPREGFISLVIDREGYPPLEVGMAGRESMLGSELVLGLAQTPWRAVVHGPGDSWRVSAAALRRALNALPVLRRVMQASLMVRLHQQVLTAACERFHMVGPRLARWLLMSQDRAQADSFPITQELLALLLGVRRVSVTQAAGDLQRAGLIQYHRGKITVLDREGLMEESCHCYQADRQLLNELSINARPS
jgi:CRP-like cAMP-binding protein